VCCDDAGQPASGYTVRTGETARQHCGGPIGGHCTAMVAIMRFKWWSSTSTFPGTSTEN
jgi:hypothetical protein